ncbi:hypothetical protein V8E55_002430 [Tylopilus felleus]
MWSLDLLPPGSVSALSLTSVIAVIWRSVEGITPMILISATQTECWYNVARGGCCSILTYQDLESPKLWSWSV